MVNTLIALGPIDTHYGGKETETVKIRHGSGFAVINRADFDPAKHELFSEDEGENRHGEKGKAGIWALGQRAPTQVAGNGESVGNVGNTDRDCANGGNRAGVNAGRGKGTASERGERARERSGPGGRYAQAAATEQGTASEGGEGNTEAGTERSVDAGSGTD